MADPSLQVLLVEETGGFRTLLLKMLRRSGFHVHAEVATEREAVETVQQLPVDVVICNWDAPESSGIRLLRRLRKSPLTENLPFILMNERIDEGAIALAADYEADGQLVTPISQSMVENMIRAVLRRRASATEEVIRLARAGAFVDVGAADEAVGEIEAAQRIAPRSPRIWTKSGELYEDMDEDRRAKSCYTTSVKVDENYTRAYDRMGELFRKEGNLDGALKLIERAAVISPRNAERQTSLAKVHIGKGNVEEARRALRTAAALEGEKAQDEAVAEFFMANGRADLAEGEFTAALEKDPTNIHVYNRLGISLRHQRKYRESVRNYHKALSIAPDDEILHFNMALALYGSGDTYQAKASLRRALMLRPDFREAREALARLGG